MSDTAAEGNASLAACQAVCNARVPACEAFEYYPINIGHPYILWVGRCHTFPGTPGSGGSSSNPVTQGYGVGSPAECYIKGQIITPSPSVPCSDTSGSSATSNMVVHFGSWKWVAFFALVAVLLLLAGISLGWCIKGRMDKRCTMTTAVKDEAKNTECEYTIFEGVPIEKAN